MSLRKTTPVPNIIFDSLLSHFTEAELKVFLVIVRKTIGWYDKKTGNRKQRDWISLSQFQQFTGLSDVSIWKAVASLSDRKYIIVTDSQGIVLYGPEDRKGQRKLFYQLNQVLLNIFQ